MSQGCARESFGCHCKRRVRVKELLEIVEQSGEIYRDGSPSFHVVSSRFFPRFLELAAVIRLIRFRG